MSVELPDVGRLAGECGYYNGAWHKQPMLLGVSDSVREAPTATSTGGVAFLLSSVVPAGEVWVIDYIAASDYETDLNQIQIGVRVGATDYWIANIDPPGADRKINLQGPITLVAGERIAVAFMGTANGDSLSLYVNGRKIAVA